jgi:hypothetical protein
MGTIHWTHLLDIFIPHWASLFIPLGDRLRTIFIIPVDRRWYIIQLVIAIGHIYWTSSSHVGHLYSSRLVIAYGPSSSSPSIGGRIFFTILHLICRSIHITSSFILISLISPYLSDQNPCARRVGVLTKQRTHGRYHQPSPTSSAAVKRRLSGSVGRSNSASRCKESDYNPRSQAVGVCVGSSNRASTHGAWREQPPKSEGPE